MITLLDNALNLGTDCHVVSCQFDPRAPEQQSMDTIASAWGVPLPEKLRNAVAKRKAEFIAGRYCALRALELLGNDTANAIDISIGDKRQPLWPEGITGSITHSHGFAAAAVASNHSVRGIGIDSEQTINPKTAQNVASHILTEEERFEDTGGIVGDSDQFLTLVFSAKESIFKCLYPLVKQYFDFKDAKIIFSKEAPQRFTFVLRKTLTEEFCEGYHGDGLFQLSDEFVHTAVVLKR